MENQEQPTASSAPAMSVHSSTKKHMAMMAVASGLFLAVAFLLGYYAGGDKAPAAALGDNDTNDIPVAIVPDGKGDGEEVETVNDYLDDGEEVSERGDVLEDGIVWFSSSVHEESTMSPALKAALDGTPTGIEFASGLHTYSYSLGEVSVAASSDGDAALLPYGGYTLKEEHYQVGELGGNNYLFYTLIRGPHAVNTSGPEVVILTKYSDGARTGVFTGTASSIATFPAGEIQNLVERGRVTLSAASIPELTFTGEVMTQGDVTYRPVTVSGVNKPIYDVSLYPIVGETKDGRDLRAFRKPITRNTKQRDVGFDGGIFAERLDGSHVWFDIDLALWPRRVAFSGQYPTQSTYTAVPTVTLNIGDRAMTATYLKAQMGGCGFSDIGHVVDANDIVRRAEIGYVTGNSTLKVYGADYFDGSFDDEFKTWGFTHSGATRADFAASIPVFYYQDQLGRWLAFTNSEVVPASECGKPVIYLYPEAPTDMTVKLYPQGGFSVTEPAYKDGWNVTAHPDGSIVNKADGLTYPYLFWEGRGGLYAEPEKYWVVANADVDGFLRSTLTKLAFNEKETADFIEFWGPRMKSAPYYKIGFHGTGVMDTLAPLELSVRPDTVIRVLMDYSELEASIPENPPTLPKTPAREGFTVMEWGGVLR